MNMADELQKLQQLRENGALNDEEFAQAKAKLISESAPSGQEGEGFAPEGKGDLDQEARQWAMFLHFSQFAGFVVPIAGLVAPIILWQLKRTELPGIDEHGKIVLNWIISELIYGIVSVLLVAVLIGIPLLLALIVVGIVFPIIGGIKANNGELWPYPLSIPFLK